MPLRLALFDLDGTLAASNEVDSDCFVEAVQAEFGFTPGSDWGAYEHCTDEGIAVEALTGHLGEPPTAIHLNRLKRRFANLLASAAAAKPHLFAPIPGAPELLRHLTESGWLLCIATGAWRVSAEIKLKASGLPESVPLFCSDGVPSREGILSAAIAHGRATAGTPVGRVVAVGDAVWDIVAAANLSLPFLGVGRSPRAARLREAGALAVVPDFLDLPEAVRCLEVVAAPLSRLR
jgi:phosphoglycolate phosphatase-like HAD superfamily hydrolase